MSSARFRSPADLSEAASAVRGLMARMAENRLRRLRAAGFDRHLSDLHTPNLMQAAPNRLAFKTSRPWLPRGWEVRSCAASFARDNREIVAIRSWRRGIVGPANGTLLGRGGAGDP